MKLRSLVNMDFKTGDKVITNNGEKGKLIKLCKCGCGQWVIDIEGRITQTWIRKEFIKLLKQPITITHSF